MRRVCQQRGSKYSRERGAGRERRTGGYSSPRRPRRRIRNLRSPLSQIKTIKEPQLSHSIVGKRCIEFLPSYTTTVVRPPTPEFPCTNTHPLHTLHTLHTHTTQREEPKSQVLRFSERERDDREGGTGQTERDMTQGSAAKKAKCGRTQIVRTSDHVPS